MIEVSPVPRDGRRFALEAREDGRVRARLSGRRLARALWIADEVRDEDGGDPAGSRRAFARAFALASAPEGGEVLVIEGPETTPWQAALVESGFLIVRRKVFVERRLEGSLPACSTALRVRSLADAGEKAFVTRMAETSEGDPFEERKGKDRDLEREWRELVESAGERFDPARWKLVDDERGAIGVVLPQAVNEETGTLYYVGVVPGRRGAGLGCLVHALGLRLLAAHGLRRYVGSTDVRNAAMRAVFERNGARVAGTEAYFRREPASAGPPDAR